jgi:hypothetical protein
MARSSPGCRHSVRSERPTTRACFGDLARNSAGDGGGECRQQQSGFGRRRLPGIERGELLPQPQQDVSETGAFVQNLTRQEIRREIVGPHIGT